MKLRLLALCTSLAFPAAAEDFDLTDLLPARPGDNVQSSDVVVKGDAVAAADDNAAVQTAHQLLMEDDGDGIKMIQVGSGTGILSMGSASYISYDNLNATLLSKRGAYNQAYLIAKKQLVENMKGVELACANLASVSMDVIDTGVEGVANTSQNFSEGCKESVSGSLAGFVTFDVYDDPDSKEVRVSLISTPKTRAQIRRNMGCLAVTTDPNSIFSQVVKDIKEGVLPPVGARVLTHAETGETVVLGFGSAIIRQNKNSAVQKKLKGAAKSQSQTRARSALLATLQGESVYWQGSFDEKQMESTEQFRYTDPYLQDPQRVEVLEEERQIFLNTLKTSDEYSTLTKGKLPAGVNSKNFTSEDGYWQYTVAVYAPSLEAEARKAARQMAGKGQPMSGKPSGRAILAVGGANDKAANPKGASGKVSQEEGL